MVRLSNRYSWRFELSSYAKSLYSATLGQFYIFVDYFKSDSEEAD